MKKFINEKADITAGRHLHGLSGIPHLGLISPAGRNGRGTSLPVIPRTWERPTYQFPPPSMVWDWIQTRFFLPISLSPTICPIGKSVWNICRRQLGMVIRTKPSADRKYAQCHEPSYIGTCDVLLLKARRISLFLFPSVFQSSKNYP